jgi:hypothetical protein
MSDTKIEQREARLVRYVFIDIEQPVRLPDGSEILRSGPVWRGQTAYVTPRQAIDYDLALMPAGAAVEDIEREIEEKRQEFYSTRQSVTAVA